MKDIRPTAAASELGWLRIAVELGPISFRRPSQPSSDGKEGAVTYKKVMNKHNTGEKIAKSMHQNTCGCGFTWRERGYVSPTVFQYHGEVGNSYLGANPRECMTIAQSWRLKNGWNR